MYKYRFVNVCEAPDLYKNFLGYWHGFCEAAAWHLTHAKKAPANQQLFYMADPCKILVGLAEVSASGKPTIILHGRSM